MGRKVFGRTEYADYELTGEYLGSHVSNGIHYKVHMYLMNFSFPNHHIYTALHHPSKPHYSGTLPHRSLQNLP